jgi:GTP cyclohydrolase II
MSLPIEELNEVASQHDASVPSNASGGVIIYLRQEGRGIGLGEKLKAYNLQDLGSDTVEANLLLRHPADARSYGLATAMLADLGLGVDSNPHGIRLLTNNPEKIRAVEGPNREVVVKERVPMVPLAWRTGGKMGIKSTEIEGYLRTKVSFSSSVDGDLMVADVVSDETDFEDGPYAPVRFFGFHFLIFDMLYTIYSMSTCGGAVALTTSCIKRVS